MVTLLFDIDGTLIQSGGAGFHAMKIALSQMFGNDDIPEVEVHGRTDRGILGDIFEHRQLDYHQHGAEFSRQYWRNLPGSLKQTRGQVLPGVVALLERLQGDSNFSLGLLTGNARRAAEIKLTHFKLDRFFQFGGFGDDHACRNEVARQAMNSARDYLNDQFDPDQVWVIGDTVNDIRCARAIGSRVITVETGGADVSTLKEHRPDAHLKDLSDSNAFIELFQLAGN